MPNIEKLIIVTRGAYRALENGADPNPVYADLKAAYAAQGLDANVAESSIDWLEGGASLLAESLEEEIARLPTHTDDEDEADEPCDCGDFGACSSCHAWAVDQLASGFSPWSGAFIKPGDDVAPLPPKWY
jgi:hypothetical protein